MSKEAIYHFTNKSERRPGTCYKQIAELRTFALSKGYEISDSDIYLDKSLQYMEHPEFDRFLRNCDQYKALITKDLYHISKNTGKCIDIIKNLISKGIQVHTLENGTLVFDDVPLDQPLRVATYTSRYGDNKEMKEFIPVKNDIFTLFVKKKTNWTIIDQYCDESQYQNDGEQVQLTELIKNREKYDLLLVHDLNEIHWRTSNFCRIRKQLQLYIYSLKEGGLTK